MQTQTTAERICKDCAHFIAIPPGGGERFERCTHPVHGIDLVLGERVRPACAAQRNRLGGPGRCGTEGHLFEPRSAPAAQPGVDAVAERADGV